MVLPSENVPTSKPTSKPATSKPATSKPATSKTSPKMWTKVKGWGATCMWCIAQAWNVAVHFRLLYIMLAITLTMAGIDVCVHLFSMTLKEESIWKKGLESFYRNKLWGNFFIRMGVGSLSRFIASILYVVLYVIRAIMLCVHICILFALRGIQALTPFARIIPHMTGLSIGFCSSWLFWYIMMCTIVRCELDRTVIRHLRKNGFFNLMAMIFHFCTFNYFELEILTDNACAWIVLNCLVFMYLFYFLYKGKDDAVITSCVEQTNASSTVASSTVASANGLSSANGSSVWKSPMGRKMLQAKDQTGLPRASAKHDKKMTKCVQSSTLTEMVMKHVGCKRKTREEKPMDMLLCENYATRLCIVTGDSTNSPLGEFVGCLKDSIVHCTSMEDMMQHLSTQHGFQVTNIAEAFLDEDSLARLESYKAMHMQVKDVDCDKAAFLYCLECICNINALCCKDIGNFLQMHKKLRLTHGDQSDPMDTS